MTLGTGSSMINKSIVELSRLCLRPFPTPITALHIVELSRLCLCPCATRITALHIQSFTLCQINQGMYIAQVRVKVI
jgi:hypothetical protein